MATQQHNERLQVRESVQTDWNLFVDILNMMYRVTRKKPYRGKSEIKEKVIKIETSYIVGKLQKFISNILVYDT